MNTSIDSRSCYDVLGELDAAAKDILSPDQPYYVLGGIATAAIKHPDSVFDHQTERLIASSQASESVVRDNGTRRDIDILVLDVLPPEEAERFRQTVSLAVGKALIVSVFGLDEHREPAAPLGNVGQLFKAWTSKRTLDTDGILRYELFPIERTVPRESFLPWALELPSGQEVPILNPAGHMLAYYMRSISGLRPKDKGKVEVMKQRILSDPIFKEQIFDGPLKSWGKFADDIANIGSENGLRELIAECRASTLELKASHWKSKTLKTLEENETIVKYAQRGLLQKLLQRVIGSS